MIVWYRVRDLDAARVFYKETLGFTEVYVDWDDRWARLERNGCELAIAEGEPEEEGGVATLDVDDVKAEAERLRELGRRRRRRARAAREMRLVDVFDPDGNRIQLAQEVSRDHPQGRRPGRPVPARHARPRLLLARRRCLRGRGSALALRQGLGRAAATSRSSRRRA